MLMLLGLALAQPLVEDELEWGSVPMYGQEVYPQAPVVYETEDAPVPPVQPVQRAPEKPLQRIAQAEPTEPEREPEPEPEEWDLELDDENADIVIASIDPPPQRAPETEPAAESPPQVDPEPDASVEVNPQNLPGPRPGIDYGEGSWQQGWNHGRKDVDVRVAPSLLPSIGAGAAIPVCGCIGATAITALVPVDENVPVSDYLYGSRDYQRGYEEGYRSGVRVQRISYALLGGAIGTSVTLFVILNA